MSDLFSPLPCAERVDLGVGVVLFRKRLQDAAPSLLAALQPLLARAPFRHMTTQRGFALSAAMTNCGVLGWIGDHRGYRYTPHDPQSGYPWPAMPEILRSAAIQAADDAGFADFSPDACLINHYAVGARMGLHQDKDEADFSQPIVSFSFGLPTLFLWGGLARRDKPQKFPLEHGDVLVWGGPARLCFHGVSPIKEGAHPLTGACRLNLTFRRAA
ncbi:MAG: DNA oxidative demethylase AlkB [Zoogloeaceae bacterium]|nr:DNA oxidative demethylase AlkB [Zoogloeaceae bacterium]